jgi:hypothetical protein
VRKIAFALLAVMAAAAGCAGGGVGPATTGVEPSPHMILLKAAQFDTQCGGPVAPRGLNGASRWSETLIVQFAGPTTQEQRSALAGRCKILGYVPNHAYVVRVPAGRRGVVAATPGVSWIGEFRPAYKVDPSIGKRRFRDAVRQAETRRGTYRFVVTLFAGELAWAAARDILALGGDVLDVADQGTEAAILVRADRYVLGGIASLDAVAFIEEAGEPALRNDKTTWVIQSNIPDYTPVWDRGLHGEGQIVGVIDGPLYVAHNCFRDPDGNPIGPTHRKVVAYRGTTGSDAHGTHTSGTIAGDQSVFTGSTYRNGMAYRAKISFTNYYAVAPDNLYTYLVAAHNDGARCHTNSWGDDSTTQYTRWCRDIDEYSYEYEDGMVAFAVTNGSTLKTPENAKNVLAVGASYQAPDQENHYSGGTGPTADGRRKPEIYAPGRAIFSARSGSTDEWQSMSGTSMACPAVTGMGALVRQYYEYGWYPSGVETRSEGFAPSGALVRATLLNGTVDMTGVPLYPNDTEGWGRLLLDDALYFAGDTRELWVEDIRNAAGLDTGDTATYALVVDSGAEPFRATLVWTDPPAELYSAYTPINNLDLRVTSPTGAVYKGNWFDTSVGQSVVGGSFDPRNNVEQVLRRNPSPGVWTVEVVGADINEGLQGYALVVTGDLEPTLVAEAPPGFVTPLWNWIGFPLRPLHPDPADILGAGRVANNLFRYDPVGKNYQIYPDDFGAVELGRGYLLRTLTELPVSLEGTAAEDPFEIALPCAGFSLIGHPHLGAARIADISIRNNALGQVRTAAADWSAADPWVNWNLLYYDSHVHTVKLAALWGGDDDALRPWYGYFLWSYVDDLTLIVPRQ